MAVLASRPVPSAVPSPILASDRLTYEPLELDEARAELAGHGGSLPWRDGFVADRTLSDAVVPELLFTRRPADLPG